MVTTVSQETKDTAQKQIDRLQKENEALKAGVQEIKQGVIFAVKDGKMHIALYEVNPDTEYPNPDGTTRTGANGKVYKNYRIIKWLYVKEDELFQVGAGERKAANIYYVKKRRPLR